MNWTLLPLSPEEAVWDEEPEAAPQRQRVAAMAPAAAADGAAAAAEAAARAAAESLSQAVAETLAELTARALADLVMELLLRSPCILPAPSSSAAEPAGGRVWTSRSSRLRQLATVKESGAPPSRRAGADTEAKGGTTSGAARSSEEAPVATKAAAAAGAGGAAVQAGLGWPAAPTTMGAVASMHPGCLSSTSTTATSATPTAAAPPAPPAPPTEPQEAAAAAAVQDDDPSELGTSLVDTTDGSEPLEEDDDGDNRSQPPPDHDDEDTGLSDGEAGEAASSSSSSSLDSDWENPPVLQPWTRFAAFATFMEPWHARAWLGLAAWQEAAAPWLACVKDRRAMWGSLVFLSIRLRSCRRRAFRSLRTALGVTLSAQTTPLLPSQKDSARS